MKSALAKVLLTDLRSEDYKNRVIFCNAMLQKYMKIQISRIKYYLKCFTNMMEHLLIIIDVSLNI
ncbi:hypothetical protein BDFB_013729 [Asbolus verrucosus]|uniref:Uncharacterized protein n=1 Tax=Asbolus verrucosus TaxID=1661398 RepID=A0A482VS06_ASBVE|nr:hypothetical protein BDFB_013729 [Asbolus verrucosus]